MCASKILTVFAVVWLLIAGRTTAGEAGTPTAIGGQQPPASVDGKTGSSADEWREPISALIRRLRSVLEEGKLPPIDAPAEQISALRKYATDNFRRWRNHLCGYAASLRERHAYEDLALIARCYDDPLAAPAQMEAWHRDLISGAPGLATALAEVERALRALPVAQRASHPPPPLVSATGIDKIAKASIAAAEIIDKRALRRLRPKERELMRFVLPWLCRSAGTFGDAPKKCPSYRLMWAFLPSDDFLPGSSVTQRAQISVPPEIKSMTGIGRYLRALAGKPTSDCFLEEKGSHPQFACSLDFAALQCAWRIVADALQPDNLASLCREAEELKPAECKIPGIRGEVLKAAETPYGYIVIGGSGANRYEDAPILALIDLGGDDDYIFRHSADAIGNRPVQIIIDLDGDDLYWAESVGGPAAGVLGISVIIDRRGNDRYCQGISPAFTPRQENRQSLRQMDKDSEISLVPFIHLYGEPEKQTGVCLDAGFAFGAGFLGIGLLVDEEGDDLYLAQKYAFGCGFWHGVGVLHDAAGDDVYVAGAAAMGVGVNGAVGLLDDRSGNDHYQCLGTFESAYSAEQPWDNGYAGNGIGYGASWRVDIMTSPLPTLGGGIGVVYDAAGDDVYVSASFAIASGFGGGLGMLVDDAGDDILSLIHI